MASVRPVARVIICRSNPVSPDPRVEKTALVLAENGYDVEVVGWDRSGQMAGAVDRDGFLLHLYRKPAAFGSGLRNLPALLTWQFFLLQWLYRNRRRYQLIHACDFDTILPALFVKRFAGKKVIYDLFDFYADHIRNTPGWIKHAIRWLERRSIAASDGVILVDEARRQQLGLVQPRRLAVISNSPLDTQPVHPDQAQHGFRLAYVGLLVKERGFDTLFSVLRRHPDWTLELAGFGGDEDAILASAASLPNVHWHGRVDYAQALQLSASSDVLFALYDPSIPNHRLSSPNKVFEAMMLGKPIVVSAGTHMDQVVQAAQCGLVVSYGDPQALERALIQLCEDETLRSRLVANGRAVYEQQYSWTVLSKRLLDLYQAVLTEASR